MGKELCQQSLLRKGENKTVANAGEEKIISLANNFFSTALNKKPNIIKGIGDDTAVLAPLPNDYYQLVTIDTIVENTHFTSATPPEKIGHKAMAVNISDIAAMGGLPTAAVISAALPKNLSLDFLEKIIIGINETAKKYNITVVGGDTVGSDILSLTISLLGKVEKQFLCERAGAKIENIIAVTGKLGGSLKTERHLTFRPRVEEARWLVKNMKPTAMMDLSDGLAMDSSRMAKASNVSIKLISKKIPVTNGFKIENALSDGEDFELLCAFDKKIFTESLQKKFEKKFNLKLTIVGEAATSPSKIYLDEKTLKINSFNHFTGGYYG